MKDQKSIAVAILLNLVIPGAGYMYMGRVILGLFALLVVTPIIVLTAGVGWFGWAIIMSIDMVLLKNKREADLQATMKKCPKCAEMVQPEAQVCRFCQHQFA